MRMNEKWKKVILSLCMTGMVCMSGVVSGVYGEELTEIYETEEMTEKVNNELTNVFTAYENDAAETETEEWTEKSISDVKNDAELSEDWVQQLEEETELLQMQSEEDPLYEEQQADQEYLEIKKPEVDIRVWNKNGTPFSDSAELEVQMLSYETNMQLMKNWTGPLAEWYCMKHDLSPDSDRMEQLLKDIANSIDCFSGVSISVSGDADLSKEAGEYRFEIKLKDPDFYDCIVNYNETYHIGLFWENEPESFIDLTRNTDIEPVLSEQAIRLNFEADHLGWFTFLSCDQEWQFETNESEEIESEESQWQESDEEDGTMAMSITSPEGVNAASSTSGYTVVSENDRKWSADYNLIRAHSNSRLIGWNNAGNLVKSGSMCLESGQNIGSYYVPVGTGAAGKFGYRVTNVAYNAKEQCYIDLLMTVSNYDNYCYDKDGKKVSDIYPIIGMGLDSRIACFFYSGLPRMVIKCDTVKSGTNTPIIDNYRITAMDIDGFQRFGIAMQNGTMAAHYAKSDSLVYVKNGTYYDRNFYLFSGDGSYLTDDPSQSLVYEMRNTSGFYLLFQQEGTDTMGNKSTNAIQSKYQEAIAGTVNGGARVDWTSYGYGPCDIAEPAKYVSNSENSWENSNTLPTSTSEYYYAIEHYVPEESSNYLYSKYVIQDQLPAGCNYCGYSKVIQLESGIDVTNWFQSETSNGKLKYAAYESILSSDNFYGYHYRFVFKVKMNPKEMTPSYQENRAVYTIQNHAEVIVKHKNDSTDTKKNTDVVTTTASEIRENPQTPYKRLEQDEQATVKEYAYDSDSFVFSIYQKLPNEESAWQNYIICMTDQLDSGLSYKDCKVFVKKPDETQFSETDGWDIEVTGQQIKATGNSNAAIMNGVIRWDIICAKKDKADYSKYYAIENNRTYIVIPDTAKVSFNWSEHGSSAKIEQQTNQARIKIPVPEINVKLKKINQDTNETITNAQFHVYEWNGTDYMLDKGEMSINEEQVYCMNNLAYTMQNQGKFKIIETDIPDGFYGEWEKEIEITEQSLQTIEIQAENRMVKGRIHITKKSRKNEENLEGAVYEIRANKTIRSPGGKVLFEEGELVDTLTTGEDGTIQSKEIFPGEYMISEIAAPPGYALDQESVLIEIAYRDSQTALVDEELVFYNDRLYSDIILTKVIDADEIVWSHGIPVFTFTIQGEDVLGNSHIYREVIEFPADEVPESGEISKQVAFHVLSGHYTAKEEKTMRYVLQQIDGIENGRLNGNEVIFDVSNGENAAAVFYNRKETDENESDAVCVRNHIITETKER